MDTLLMVGCGWMGRPYLRRAHDRGLAVAVLDSPVAFSWPETQEALGLHDRCYPVSGTDEVGWLTAVRSALADGPVVGVLGFSEPHIVAAAIVAEELGLPGPGVRAALTSRNKLMQRECFGLATLPQPDYLLARTAEQAVEPDPRHPQVVLKPLSSMGSIGVQIATTPDVVATWFAAQGDQPVPGRGVHGRASTAWKRWWSRGRSATRTSPPRRRPSRRTGWSWLTWCRPNCRRKPPNGWARCSER